MIYDVVFVGAGMANLYMAYKCVKEMPHLRFVVLEKGAHAGGRVATTHFYGAEVPLGAGVGRFDKDRLLKQLMRELGIVIGRPWKNDIQHSKKFKHVSDVPNTVDVLKNSFENGSDKSNATFEQFAKSVLGGFAYDAFVKSVGYSDYEAADVHDTLYNYGFDDTYSGSKMFHVPWRKLLNALVDAICRQHPIIFDAPVTKIMTDMVHVPGKVYKTRCVVVGSDIRGIRKLFPDKSNIYRHVCGQPFVRVYARIAQPSLVPAYTIVPNCLQKIIPIDMTTGIYMIGYADNENAACVKNVAKDKHKLAQLIQDGTGSRVQIEDVISKYWTVGTHYFRPLPKRFKTRAEFLRVAQRPAPRTFVVGEAMSTHQGWVEGALESVEEIWREFTFVVKKQVVTIAQ